MHVVDADVATHQRLGRAQEAGAQAFLEKCGGGAGLLQAIEDVRRNWPFLRDRRIDAYAGLERRFLDSE